MIPRLLALVGWRKIANLTLLGALTGLLGWELSELVHGFPRDLALEILILGIILVTILAYSHISGTRAALFCILGGIIGLAYAHAGLSNPLAAIIRTSTSIPGALLQNHTWPDLSPLALTWGQFLGQLDALLYRIGDWFSAMFQGEFESDPIMTSIIWGLTLWLIITWTNWWILRRHRPIPAITPAGIMLAGVLNYSRGNAIILAPFVAITLLLMALNRYEEEEGYWRNNDIDYAEDIRLDMITVIPLLVLGIVALASITPSVSLNQVVHLVHQVADPYQSQVESLVESLGLEQQPASAVSLDAYRNPGLPQQHLLGSGPELFRQVVMVIQTEDLPSVPDWDLLPYPPIRYYWRGFTYDIYTGQGWTTSPIESIQYSANQLAVTDIPVDNPTIHTVEQSVLFAQDYPGVLYAAGLLVTADVDFMVTWRIPSENMADAFGATSQAGSYQATSLQITPSIEQMRNALPLYPEWILARYLTLPENLPQRVKELSMELTRDQPTPYDQAVAIEAYLRGYPYSLNVPKPPVSQDVVDYFLFELKRGYCDYYATAMVVLSRAAGLPARLVSGYSSGTYDTLNARYIVTADNAHSWVEIYFSGIGWVEFEPTGSLPTINRHTDVDGLPSDIPELKPVQHFNLLRWLRGTSWLQWIFTLASLLIVTIVLWWIIDFLKLRRQPSHFLLTDIYSKLKLHGKKLAIGSQSGDTPYEFSARFYTRLGDLTSRSKFQSLLSPASDEINELIRLYAQAFYSPHPITLIHHREATRTWLRLNWRLRLVKILHNLARIKPHHQ